MKLNALFLSVAVVSGGLLAGCVSSPDGRQHFGVPFTKDRITSAYEREVREVWAAAKDVLNYNGKLYTEDVLKSVLEASVNQRTVWVKVEQIDANRTRVLVQARNSAGGADVGLAAELDKQIAIRLATGNLTPFTHPSGAAKTERATPF